MSMTRIPDHIAIRRLGKGTYGEVFLAKRKGSEKMVAVKCVPKSNLSKRAQDNLVSEIAILQKLQHKYIVRLYDFTWDSSRVYLIMEYCAGGDLSQFIHDKRRLSEKLVRHFLRQLALALQYLKLENIVHMDLKPQNILLSGKTNPVLKVTDFGFAQCQKECVNLNEIRGTLLYMAPEVYCDGFYHPSCDLWSVGVILYECLFGFPPYVSADVDALRTKLIKDEPIQLPASIPVSQECVSLLLGLLKRHPTERLDHDAFFKHPFVDLKNAPVVDCLDQAITLLGTAQQFNCRNELTDAYEHYTQGLSYLLSAIEHEPSVTKRVSLRELADEYFKQAELVKARLQQGSEQKGFNASSSKSKPPPPRRPPAPRQCDRPEGSGPCSRPCDSEIEFREAVVVMHEPPLPLNATIKGPIHQGKNDTPLTAEPSVSSSPTRDGVLGRLCGYISSKRNQDELLKATTGSTLLARGPGIKDTGENTRDDNMDEDHPEPPKQAVCNEPIGRRSSQSVNSPAVVYRSPPVRPPGPRKVRHSNPMTLHPSAQPPHVSHTVYIASATDQKDSVNLIDLNAQSPARSPAALTCDPNSSESHGKPTTDSPCYSDLSESLKRLQELSLQVVSPDASESTRSTFAHKSDDLSSSALGNENTERLMADKKRLSNIRSLCSSDDACATVLLRLEEFYILLRSNEIPEALSHFAQNFQICLNSAKADANEVRRRAILSELKLVLDLVEGVKLRQSTTTTPDGPCSPTFNYASQGIDVGEEATETSEESCCTS